MELITGFGELSERNFWDFSLRHYLCQEQLILCDGSKASLYAAKQTAVNKDILLSLQDSYAYNVNLVLAALYSALHGKSLSLNELYNVQKSLTPLDAVTQALRQKRIKIAANEISESDIKNSEEYKQALQQELESEQEQQVFIINALKQIKEYAQDQLAVTLNESHPLDAALIESSLLNSMFSLFEKSNLVNSAEILKDKQSLKELLRTLISRIIRHEIKYREHAKMRKNSQNDEL